MSKRELSRRLMYALYSADELFYVKAKEKKMNYTELVLLYALDGDVPLSQKDISNQMFFPATTVNTIVKLWEKKGIVIQIPVEGKRRETHIVLTEAGKQYARNYLDFIYKVEEKAMQKTLEKYSESFIEALEYYSVCVRECIDREEESSHEEDFGKIVE